MNKKIKLVFIVMLTLILILSLAPVNFEAEADEIRQLKKLTNLPSDYGLYRVKDGENICYILWSAVNPELFCIRR